MCTSSLLKVPLCTTGLHEVLLCIAILLIVQLCNASLQLVLLCILLPQLVTLICWFTENSSCYSINIPQNIFFRGLLAAVSFIIPVIKSELKNLPCLST
jgi:hypothetical protein